MDADRIFRLVFQYVTAVSCITYPFVIVWRFDLLKPERQVEFDFFLYKVMPWDVITFICWAKASLSNPGYISTDYYLPLPVSL
jgi:hypothetical protein